MKLLISIPDENNEHADRAWAVASEFLEAELQQEQGIEDVRLVVGDRGGIGDPDAAIVFNSQLDRTVLGEMRARSIPTLYSLGLGSVEDWRPADPNAQTADFRRDRRIKIRMADLVQVDSQLQANVAASFFRCEANRWLVLPPAPVAIYDPRELQPVQRVILADTLAGFDIQAWADGRKLSLERPGHEFEVVKTAEQSSNVLVLWNKRSYYAEALLTVAARGVRLAALSSGLCPEDPCAEWYDGGEVPGRPLELALERALAWSADQVRNQVDAARRMTWQQWAVEAIRALRGTL